MMLRKKIKYFLFSVFFLSLILNAESPKKTAGQYLYLQMEEASFSPRAKLIFLMDQISHQTNLVLPYNHLQKKSFPVTISYLPKDKLSGFELKIRKNGSYNIRLPDTITVFQRDPELIYRLTGLFLLARNGMGAELEPEIRNTWFVVGLARYYQREFQQVKTPFTSYYPAAYVLTSYRKYPSLHSLLTTPLMPDDGMPRLLYEEYSELLVHACQKKGLFHKGLLSTLLNGIKRNGKKFNMEKTFRDTFQKIAAHKKKEFNADDWFRESITFHLSWNFLPESAFALEQAYQKAIQFTASAKGNSKDKKPQIISGNLHDLVRESRKLRSPGEAAASMAKNIFEITRFASPDMVHPLHNVRIALLHFGQNQNDETAKALLAADKNFYAAIERNLLLEKFLAESEIRGVVPSAQYYYSLRRMNYYEHSVTTSYIKQLSEFMRLTIERNLLP